MKHSRVLFVKYKILVLIFGILSFTFCKASTDTAFSGSLAGITVYEFPNFNSPIIGKIPFGEKFLLILKDNLEEDWKKVEYKDISGFIYQKEFSFEPPSNFIYVDNLEGVKLYQTPSYEKPIQNLAHKTKLELLEIVDKDLHTENSQVLILGNAWIRVKYNQIEGYIPLDGSIKLQPKVHYFFVRIKEGLNLYAQPSMNSKILINLPKGTIGEILETNPNLERHGDTKGYWFKTEYKSKIGWGFSAYITTSTDPNYFEEKDYISEEELFISFLSSIQVVPSYSPTKLDFKNSKVKTLNNNKIFEVNYNYPKDNCEVTTNSRVVFQNLRLNQFYSNQDYYEEKILSIGNPFPESVYTEVSVCHCCCGDFGNNLYFLFENKIQYVSFSLENSKGKCIYGPIETFEYYKENRIDKEKKILYSFLKLPICKERKLILEAEEESIDATEFSHTLFIVLKVKSDHINIEKYYDEDIPSKYKQEWEKLK